jgi:hypothetical protein
VWVSAQQLIFSAGVYKRRVSSNVTYCHSTACDRMRDYDPEMKHFLLFRTLNYASAPHLIEDKPSRKLSRLWKLQCEPLYSFTFHARFLNKMVMLRYCGSSHYIRKELPTYVTNSMQLSTTREATSYVATP